MATSTDSMRHPAARTALQVLSVDALNNASRLGIYQLPPTNGKENAKQINPGKHTLSDLVWFHQPTISNDAIKAANLCLGGAFLHQTNELHNVDSLRGIVSALQQQHGIQSHWQDFPNVQGESCLVRVLMPCT
jgi:hypothetical protein